MKKLVVERCRIKAEEMVSAVKGDVSQKSSENPGNVPEKTFQ